MATSETTHTGRTLKYGTNVVVGTILFLVVLVMINYFAGRFRWRADLTRSKQYTVSLATKNLLGSLKDVVTVTVYATEQDTPPEWTEQRNQLRDLLYEYRIYAGNRLNYTFKDPSADPKAAREAEQAGIREIPMQKTSTTELSVKMGWLGMVVQYRAKSEPIRAIRPDSSLEYQLTRAINKVAEVRIPTIGVMAPGGNPFMGEQGNFTAVNQFLELEGYKVKSVDSAKPDLGDVNLLMAFEPGELSEEALYRIDQYIMNGGKMFVAASGVEIDPRSGQAQAKSPNINSLLESYGVRVDQDLLEDWGKGVLQSFMTLRGFVQSRNPFMVEVTDLSKESLITKQLPRFYSLFGSSVSKSEQGTSATVEVLARTSERTKKQEQFFILQQERLKPPAKGEPTQSYNLMMSVKATDKAPLTSRFAVVEPPAITKDDGTTRAVAASEVKTKSAPGAEVILMGSTISFYNDIIARGEGQINGILLLNIADALTRGGDLIALRSKQSQNATLKPVCGTEEPGDENVKRAPNQIGKTKSEGACYTVAQARTSEALVIGAMPVLLVVFGLLKAYANRMKRVRYRDIYGRR